MAVVDPAAGRVIGRIPVPKGPHGLVVTPDGRKAYVSSDGDRTVSVIDTATDRVVATLDVGPNRHGLAVSPDGRRVLVSAWGVDEALIIDTGTNRIGEAPRKIAVQPGARAGAAGPGPRVVEGAAVVDARGKDRVALEAGDHYFRPALIRGTPGRPLVLATQNATGTLHNLEVQGQPVVDIPPGRVVEVPATVPLGGTLRFGCTIHGALGMEGEILAGDAAPSRAAR